MLFLFVACAVHPPVETPALVLAAGPVRTVPLPAGERVRVALRAGSAHDPPGREGLAWVTAHAIAAAAGAEVEVGAEIVVYAAPLESVPALALALAAPPSAERVAAAREAAVQTLDGLDCRALAERVWDSWIYAGHPYGHAPEGRRSVLPTLTATEVAAFQEVRYVRSVAVVGVPTGARVDAAAFDTLPPRMSVSPVPSVRLPLPDARVLVVTAPDRRCLVAGHPTDAPSGDLRAADALFRAPSDGRDTSVVAPRRQGRHLVTLPLPPHLGVDDRVTEVLDGAWLPLWEASRAFAPEVAPWPADALAEELLSMHPWPSLAHPISSRTGAPAADLSTASASSASPASVDAALAGWLTPSDTRVVVVLPPDDPSAFESLAAAGVQAAMPAQELLR
ncbi:MAG: hypothetical protein Q8P41_05455 [Pseudomonadota bacterium]|nr:hypothetical protein [Pseudomonadota bacterium]